jgi:cyclophilin family peptidyl-prolyl cis-trans isomerase
MRQCLRVTATSDRHSGEGRTHKKNWIPAFAGMTSSRVGVVAACFALCVSCQSALAAEPAKAKPTTMADVIAASKPADWRPLDPANTLYLDLAAGRVVIELAPAFAPLHAANIKTMVREHYFDGLAILRVQDNFVTQWGDPDSDKPEKARALGKAAKTVAAEFERASGGDWPFAFTPLADGDVYAPEVGFVNGMPAARDTKAGKAWLAHCYGMVGAGRDVGEETGSGAELYVVIGQAPRQLDRNIAVVGRVVQGMELLASLPRGTGPLGFYEKPEQRRPIKSVRLAADVPATERTNLEVMRTETATFAALVESRRNRRDDWYKVPAGKIDLCNVPIPARPIAASAKP